MSTVPPGSGQIAVRVTAFADLRRYLPRAAEGPARWVLPAGATVSELLDAIGIPPGYDLTVGVDGELAERATALRDGAEVLLLAPMEGGSAIPAPRPGRAPRPDRGRRRAGRPGWGPRRGW